MPLLNNRDLKARSGSFTVETFGSPPKRDPRLATVGESRSRGARHTGEPRGSAPAPPCPRRPPRPACPRRPTRAGTGRPRVRVRGRGAGPAVGRGRLGVGRGAGAGGRGRGGPLASPRGGGAGLHHAPRATSAWAVGRARRRRAGSLPTPAPPRLALGPGAVGAWDGGRATPACPGMDVVGPRASRVHPARTPAAPSSERRAGPAADSYGSRRAPAKGGRPDRRCPGARPAPRPQARPDATRGRGRGPTARGCVEDPRGPERRLEARPGLKGARTYVGKQGVGTDPWMTHGPGVTKVRIPSVLQPRVSLKLYSSERAAHAPTRLQGD